MPKLETLYALDEVGMVTSIRGVDVQQDAQLIAVLTEQNGVEPPRSTSWVLTAAYEFAEKLQDQANDSALLDALRTQEKK